ncbi:unnamed protein product [Adineta steineri]|uniref:Uncharacterized protein n=1 Tax=Adineta steineri TaxID=433720 RepID=A0A815TEK5_9BILA|nr:unnamed protein product [Adineta steineri]
MSSISQEHEQKTNSNKIQNQHSSLSNDSIARTNPMNNSHPSQSLPRSNLTLNLYDCLQCYLRIPRCKLTQDHSNDKANTCMTFEDEIRGEQEVEEKPSQEESIF